MGQAQGGKKRLGDMLVQEGLINQAQLEQAVEVQRVKGGRLGDILVGLKMCAEDRVLAVLARRAGVPYVSSLSAYGSIPADVLALLPGETVRRQGVFPLSREAHTLTVALSDPFADFNAVDELKIQTGCEIKVVLASEKEIQKAVERYYPLTGEGSSGLSGRESAGAEAQMETILKALLETAGKVGADRVYMEPHPGAGRVRFRVKGVLQRRPDIPWRYLAALAGHVKRLARLNAAECWLPQEGRLRLTANGKAHDVKVATLPTAEGEKLVLTLLDPAREKPLDLEKLGFVPEDLASLKKMLEGRRGLVVVTGPAGSGKTSTLYAALQSLNTPDRHVLTIEDPVERFLEGVTQVQVRADARMTLASGLSVLRRQAPDVLFVSDVPNAETAEAALDAAADCLVLCSLEAADTARAVQRFLDLGAHPPLVANRLAGLIAQRLVRAICPNCRESYTLSLRELMSAGVGEKEIRGAKRAASFPLSRGRGCGQCLATGYDGAAAVFEVCPMTENIRRLIADRAGAALFARETAERVSLREAAVRKVLAGETTVEEALGISRGDAC